MVCKGLARSSWQSYVAKISHMGFMGATWRFPQNDVSSFENGYNADWQYISLKNALNSVTLLVHATVVTAIEPQRWAYASRRCLFTTFDRCGVHMNLSPNLSKSSSFQSAISGNIETVLRNHSADE